jgi:hypothetical protein
MLGRDNQIHSSEIEATSVFDAACRFADRETRYYHWRADADIFVEVDGKRYCVLASRLEAWRVKIGRQLHTPDRLTTDWSKIDESPTT